MSVSFAHPFVHRLFPQRQSAICTRRARRLPVAIIAIVGTLPSTFAKAVLSDGVLPSDISLDKATEQHVEYCNLLSRVPSVTALHQSPSDPSFPDGVFVEDPLVIISNRTAFIPCAGHESREGESIALTTILKRIGVRVRHAQNVRLDGGDVLRIPGFVLVGISERTEHASLKVLQNVFDEDAEGDEVVPSVVPIEVIGGLHLKSLVTWVGGLNISDKGFLVVPDSEDGNECLRRIQKASKQPWDVLKLPEAESLAGNMLFVHARTTERGSVAKGAVFIQQSCPTSIELLRCKLDAAEVKNVDIVTVDTSEIAKANGALTCMSVLV